jgi:hypothetical protein
MNFDYFWWAVAAVLDGWLLAAIVDRGYTRRFPWLTVFLWFKLIVRHALLLALSEVSYTAYFYGWWSSYFCLIVLYGLIICELFLFTRKTFWISFAAIFVMAVLLALTVPSRELFFMRCLRTAEMIMWASVCGLFLWALLDRPCFHLRMEKFFALGMVTYAIAAVSNTLLSAICGYQVANALRSAPSSVYCFVVVLWITGVSKPLEPWFLQAAQSPAFMHGIKRELTTR